MEPTRVMAELAQLIPEGYVDVIRRVTPGVIFWLVLHFLTGFPTIPSGGFGIASLVVFLFASYATGMLLDGIADFFSSGFFIRSVWKDFPDDMNVNAIAGVLHLAPGEVPRPRRILGRHGCRKWKVPDLIREEVTRTNPKAAMILPKVVAEECLLKNVALGMLLVIVAIVVAPALADSGSTFCRLHTTAVLVLLGFVVVSAAVAAFHRAHRTLIRTLAWFRRAHPSILTPPGTPKAGPIIVLRIAV